MRANTFTFVVNTEHFLVRFQGQKLKENKTFSVHICLCVFLMTVMCGMPVWLPGCPPPGGASRWNLCCESTDQHDELLLRLCRVHGEWKLHQIVWTWMCKLHGSECDETSNEQTRKSLKPEQAGPVGRAHWRVDAVWWVGFTRKHVHSHLKAHQQNITVNNRLFPQIYVWKVNFKIFAFRFSKHKTVSQGSILELNKRWRWYFNKITDLMNVLILKRFQLPYVTTLQPMILVQTDPKRSWILPGHRGILK